MTQEQMEQVLAQQLPQFTKKSLASFVVLTDQHKGNTALQLKRILQQLGVI
jgi:dephospho-CoA kinase